MPRLVLGPLLRYTGDDDATIWVETDAPCEVEVLGCRERTFHVSGHHYALVHVTGLEPEATIPYAVALDGEHAWPEPDSPYPPSVIRTVAGKGAFRIAWGSCRVDAPHEPPYSLRKDEHPAGREVDALRVLADHMCREADPAGWPHALVMLGDQVYADEVGVEVREHIRATRDVTLPPYETVANFEEYTWLYRASWSEPHIRWLLSTVPSAMIFDDHDVHDDWNTSKTWVDTMRATGWWDERIVGGFATYWLYQHMGNLSPQHLAQDDLYAALRAAEDGGPLLREFAFRADREVAGTRWSYCRDFGRTRLVMIDSRAGRVLDPPEDRSMLDPHEWAWLEAALRGRLRPSPAGDVAAAAARARPALPGVLERGGLQRRVAQAGRAARRALAPGGRPRALGGVRRLADARRRAGPGRGHGREGRAAGVDRRALGRRAPRLPRGGDLAERHGDARAVLPGHLLAVPQPARRARAAVDPLRLQQGGDARREAARPVRRGRRSADPLALQRGGALLRQPGLLPRARRPHARTLRLQKTVPGENQGYSLETVFERTIA